MSLGGDVITLKIENPEIEQVLFKFANSQKKQMEEVAIEAIREFITSFNISYTKKNVSEHKHVIHKEYDDSLTDDVALEHIQNSAEYIHNLRRH